MTTDIFISYSLKDADFCSLIFSDLSEIYEVWVDRHGIRGGIDWELEIEKAIRETKIFIVIISDHSRNSKWVRREIHFAESKNKVIIPILLKGEIPISLIERHFVDFQGDYSYALTELRGTIISHVEPSNILRKECNRLLGEAIMSFLWRDFRKADNLVEQAIQLNKSIAKDSGEFWKLLSDTFSTVPRGDQIYAETYSELISFKERAEEAGNYDSGTPMYKWSVWIHADIEVISNIERVIYHLHETFPNPIQSIRNKGNNFMLTRLGWGTFTLRITVVFIDNSEKEYSYSLTFRNSS